MAKHWSTAHSAESKPFQFYAVALVNCFYCDEGNGTYNDLLQHHKERHAEALFVITDRMDPKMCGMCDFMDGDLSEHFKTKHDLSSTPKIFNPICYSEERIAHLLTANPVKKHQCGECNQIFDRKDEFVAHSRNSHNGQAVQSKEVIDTQIKADHLICNFCNKNNVDINRYLEHLSEHTFNFRCTMNRVCKYESLHLSQVAFHEKDVHDIDSLSFHCSIFPSWMKKKLFNTDVVFTNGLMFKSYNLLGTSFDVTELVDKFIHGFLDNEKQEAKKMFARGKSLNPIRSSSDENERLSSNETNQNRFLDDAVLNETSNNANPPVEPTPTKMIEKLGRHGESSKHRTKRDGIDKVASKSKRDSTESRLMSELRDQQELIKNLYVQGVRRDLNITDRLGTFLKLCREMDVAISRNNIESIDQCRMGIIVKLHRLDIKSLIMYQTRGKVIWSNELFKLPDNHKPWKIFIGHHMTQYYSDMWFYAMDLKKRNCLHSFKLTEHGLEVKRTLEDNEKIVLSEEQLRDHVRSTQSLRSRT